jgi:ubiquinone/menaquinone biosynthesis C-methylase UbiE
MSTARRAEQLARRTWSALPPVIRNAKATRRLRHRLLTVLRGEPPPIQRVITTIAELDDILGQLDEAARVSDDELRRGFASFRMELDRAMPLDPFSSEYRQAVMELYEWLHGSPYELGNEHTPFDVEQAVDVPFPYATASGTTVGHQLIAIGHVIRTLDLPPNSRVLELGAGWGNTTLALAQMGHNVTAIDCSQDFVNLMEARAARVHATVHTHVGDFSAIRDLPGPFDAVLFFESFHHCTDHQDLLARLDRIVAPGGRVLFAAEPIEEHFPVPWGLRLDGESLWAIRKNGWFELGFRTSYFLEALRRVGWSAEAVNCPESPWGDILVARRIREAM